MSPSPHAIAMFALTQIPKRRQRENRAGRCCARALACLSLLALAGLLTAPSALGALTHPFLSTFMGSDTPQGSLGTEAEKLGVRQSTGNVYVIATSEGVVDIFDASGAYVSQIGSFGFGADPDIAIDNSATASEGHVYVLPENGPLSAYDTSGTLLFQLDGSTTPIGDFGDVCGTAVDSGGNVYVADFSNQVIYKFDSTGAYLTTIDVAFSPCDVAIDTDGTIYATAWNQAVHKLDPTGTVDLGVIDSQSPRGVSVDLASHHVYVVHDSSIIEYDAAGTMVSQFGTNRLTGTRGVDINGATGNVYVSTNPSAGGEVAIFGPLAVVTEVTTEDATNVTGTSATLNGLVDPADAGDVTECHFEYGTDTMYGNSAPCVPAPPYAGPTDVSADASPLTESTTYHFALVVTTNSAGTLNGGDKTFQTPGPPTIVSESATNVTDTGATLNATVTPNGGDTTCQFQYVDDAAFQASGYDTATSVDCSPFDLGSSFDPQTTSANVVGLTPHTLYHFRVVAMNPAGTTTGDDTTFQTLQSFLVFLDAFGAPGSGSGQFQTPVGVAVDQRGGKVYVADSANARIQKFDSTGAFMAAWGWGVTDGASRSEVCTSSTCRAGIPGSGAGQLSAPTSVAVDNSKSASKGDVYVGDAGNNAILKFGSNGKYVATIDGSTAPQGHFVSLVGVAVDENGNLWAADAGTGNVIEFDALGHFVQQWTSPSSMQAIAVDASHGAVYLILGDGTTQRFGLTGEGETMVDAGSGTALALDPQTGNLYVDHSKNVAIYNADGTRIDTLFSLANGSATESHGLAYYGKGGSGTTNRLYVSDAVDDVVAIYGPPAAGAPFITNESTVGAGATAKTLVATIVPLGSKTTCTFQYVTSSDFAMNGYTNATTVPCTPASLGSSFTYQQATATISGLTIGTFYTWRAVATNAAGTTLGADQTFQAGPGAWTPFSRCPVDDPAMLATDGVTLVSLCVASNSTHGSITIGNLPPTITGNSNLQGGLVADLNSGIFTFVAAVGGSLIADPATVSASGITVVATVESAGTPTNFDLLAGLSLGAPIVTLPVKIHLVSQTSFVDLGPSCYIGSDADPIVLHPANTDLSNVTATFVSFDADGTIDPNGPLAALTVSGATQGDSMFSVPSVNGCGPNGDGSFDALLDAVIGLPSPSGANTLVLDDASSALVLPNIPMTGQQFADAWHSAFGATPPTTTTTTTMTTTSTTGATTSSTTTTTTAATTSTTTTATTTTTTTPTVTTTTTPALCGNGVVDPGEACDPSSPSGALLCGPGEQCTASCTCEPIATTTTTGVTTTSTTAASTTTTTETTTTVTTTTAPQTAAFMDFTTSLAGGVCGNTYSDTTGTTVLKNLTCGGLDLGGGGSTVPEGPIPDGSTSRFTASCTGTTCTLGPTSASGATFDCTDTGCNFGPPLGVPNGGLSTCIQNTFAAPASGTLDTSTGVSSTSVSLNSNVVVTANATQPCPICRVGTTTGPVCAGMPSSPCTGVCEGSANQGAACTSTNSQGLSRDCPQPAGGTCYKGSNNGAACTSGSQCPGGVCTTFVGTLAVNLSPLTTGTAEASDAGGIFCPGQTSAGCFQGGATCKLIRETGSPAGTVMLSVPVSTTLASVFCVPASGNILIDGAAALPGPGALTLPGTAVLLP